MPCSEAEPEADDEKLGCSSVCVLPSRFKAVLLSCHVLMLPVIFCSQVCATVCFPALLIILYRLLKSLATSLQLLKQTVNSIFCAKVCDIRNSLGCEWCHRSSHAQVTFESHMLKPWSMVCSFTASQGKPAFLYRAC